MEKQFLSISSFKKFFLLIIIIGLLVFIPCLVLTRLFEKGIMLSAQNSGPYKVNRIINDNSNTLPFFGSSRAESSVVPSLLCENCFNYGRTGLQDNSVLFMLKEELKKNKTEPVLINFDLDGMNYAIGDISDYLYNSNNRNVQELLNSSFSSFYLIPVIKYYGKYELYLKSYLRNNMEYNKKVDRGGEYQTETLPSEFFMTAVDKRRNTITNFSNDTVLENQFYTAISSTNRNIVFIVTPYHPSFYESFRGEDKYNRFVSRFRELPNFRMFDFGRMQVHDSLFFDTSHLNYEGACFFTAILKDTLQKYSLIEGSY